MPDVGDIGKKYSDYAEKTTVAAIQARIPDHPSATECEDCGKPIPDGRRAAYRGCTRCVGCQTAFEVGGRQ